MGAERDGFRDVLFMGQQADPEAFARVRVYDGTREPSGPLSPMCDRCEFHADPCATPCPTLVSLGWRRRGDDPEASR